MQGQPFTIDHMCEYRQVDLHAAALDVRCQRYSEQSHMRRRLMAWLTAAISRGPQSQAQPSAPGTSVRPVTR